MSFIVKLINSAFATFLVVFTIFFIFVNYYDFFVEVPTELDEYWVPDKKIEVPSSFKFSRIPTNGIHLNVIEAGPSTGQKLILLHGYPETALLSWSEYIGAFAKDGYHVIAPDMRGYNTSDKPDAVYEYRLSVLCNDIIGLLDYFKSQNAIVAAHDWGGIVAWRLAQDYSERVSKLIILNSPHSEAYKNFIISNPSQLSKSSYIFLYNIPQLGESKFPRKNFAMMRCILAFAGTKGKSFGKESIQRYIQGWREPKAIDGMLAYYRALLRHRESPKNIRVNVPTLILWGKKDVALDENLAKLSLEYCDKGKLVFFDEASHFVQHDESEKVYQEISSFIKA